VNYLNEMKAIRRKSLCLGEILDLYSGGILLQCGDGVLKILKLQPAGKKQMTAADFFNGRRIQLGEYLE
jgi:methionyl-tRNA formyltransferase